MPGIRGQHLTKRDTSQWTATIILLQSAPTDFHNIGYAFYIVFIISNVALVWNCIPVVP